MLTAIVISFGTTALLLALAYRSWLLTADDEVADDVDDRIIGRDGVEDTEVEDAGAVDSTADGVHRERAPAAAHRAAAAGRRAVRARSAGRA